MRNAKKTLSLLNLLASSPTVAPAFLGARVAGKAAYAVVHFLEVLLGPRAGATLRVEKPEKYGFDPKQLVLSIVEFTVRLDGTAAAVGGAAAGFAAALAAEDDYDGAMLAKAGQLLITHTYGAADLPPRLEGIINAVSRVRNGGGGGAGGGFGGSSTTPGKSPLQGTADGVNGGGGGAAAEGSPAEAAALMAALGAESAEWEVAYVKNMGGANTFKEADGGEPIRDFFAQFDKTCCDDDTGGLPSKAKQKKLAREAASLSEGQLPCEVGSGVFLRHDPNRLDRMRAVITGPEGTPYSGGAFVFDVYFPAGYPEKPPMVNLDTTGGGRVRFNPNLYADGKVCLSLLGTWHSGGLEEKWDAKLSTLYQVLVSIQGLILVDDPMYNEPGFDGIRGTAEGDNKSREHNEEIRLYTVRHAMIAHLKHPRPGVEALLSDHFRMQRHRVLREVLRWCEEAQDPTRRRRLWEAARELAGLLAQNAAAATA
mmetsp:Transcript_12872/g.31044  ORF Transcript_12872/g.31044 Transcript_12872/m.31044 type:complete len:482 (-) Transcript_12872:194-1639(-)